jgi:hypothetical protein
MLNSMMAVEKRKDVLHGKVQKMFYRCVLLFHFFDILDILIGLITVTFINCSALCGAIILPFRKKSAFKWILTGFIGLGRMRVFIMRLLFEKESFQLLEHLLERGYFI